MTNSEQERLAVVESKMDGLDTRMERIEGKLDTAIECKADKAEVATVAKAIIAKADKTDFDDMRRLLVGILVSIAGTAIVILIGIFIYLLQGHITIN